MSNRSAFARGAFAVSPTGFGTNPEALLDNKFMKAQDNQDSNEFSSIIMNEHKQFIQNIQAAGLEVTVLEMDEESNAPDAVFPDWFTTYKGESMPEGVLIIHPMKYQTRRNERTPELIRKLQRQFKHTIDLTHFEETGGALEGKGSVVFDHRNRKFYITLSNRATIEVVEELVEKWNQLCVDGATNPYRAVTFTSYDARGDVIYHTDCMMTIHGHHAMACLDSVKDQDERAMLIEELTSQKNPYPVEILELSQDQIEYMSANA